MEHAGLSREQASALGKHEQDLGSVDVGEAMPVSRAQQTEPTIINVGYLPGEHPMCPCCHTGLHVVRQNAQGDSLFECIQAGCPGDGYMAVFRIAGPRWDHYQGRYGAERPQDWKPPVRRADLEAVAAQAKPAEPQEKPAQAWPEGELAGPVKLPVAASEGQGQPKESKSVQRRKAAQRAPKQ
jgi:hypothetical protein